MNGLYFMEKNSDPAAKLSPPIAMQDRPTKSDIPYVCSFKARMSVTRQRQSPAPTNGTSGHSRLKMCPPKPMVKKAAQPLVVLPICWPADVLSRGS